MADTTITHQRRHVSKLVPRSPVVLIGLIIAISAADSVLVGYDSSIMGSLNVMPTYQSYFKLTTATKSLNSAIQYVGGSCSCLLAGPMVDRYGRKPTIYLSCIVTVIGAVIQAAAQNIAMFIVGRFIIGMYISFELSYQVINNLLRIRPGHCTSLVPNLSCRVISAKVATFRFWPLLCVLVSWCDNGFGHFFRGMSQRSRSLIHGEIC
jgi:MFS family permease